MVSADLVGMPLLSRSVTLHDGWLAGEAVGLGKQRVFGLAWAGEEAVAKVELSTDGDLGDAILSFVDARRQRSRLAAGAMPLSRRLA